MLEDSLEMLSLESEELISLDATEEISEERSEDCPAGEELSEEGVACEAEEDSAEDWGCAEEAGPLLFDDESALKMEHEAKRAPTDSNNKALIGFFIQKSPWGYFTT